MCLAAAGVRVVSAAVTKRERGALRTHRDEMLSDFLLSKREISALIRALTSSSDRPLVFPADGSGAPRQRPIPGAQLQLWLRVVLRMTSFQFIWALVFFVLSFTRRSLIGAILNLPYAGCAALGLFGALKLSYAFVSTSLLASLAVDVMFLTFCLWSYFDTGEWEVLAMYLPGLAVDAFVLSSCVPLVLHLYRAEHSAAYPAPSPAPAPELAEVMPTHGRSRAPQSGAEPQPTSAARAGCTTSAVAPAPEIDADNGPLAAVLEFRCPITLVTMVDPVIAADGHSYERAALEAWLANHRTSPFTGAPLEHMHVTPNHRLRSMIESAREVAASSEAVA